MGKQIKFTDIRDSYLQNINSSLKTSSKEIQAIRNDIPQLRKDLEDRKIYDEYEKKKKQQKALNDLRAKNQQLYLANSTVVGRLFEGFFGDRSGTDYWGAGMGTAFTNRGKDKDGNYLEQDGSKMSVERVNELIEGEAIKHSASDAYHYGAEAQDMLSSALRMGLKGALSTVPTLAEFVVSAAGNAVDDFVINPFRDDKDKLEHEKAGRKNAIERTLALKSLLNKATGGYWDALNENLQSDNNELEKIYAEERKTGKQVSTGTEDILDVVFGRGINKGIDWFTDGLGGDQNTVDTYKDLKTKIYDRAREMEGRSKQELYNMEGLAPLSERKVGVTNKVFDATQGKLVDFNKQFNEEILPEGSSNLLDTQVVARNDDGSVKVDRNNMPVYVNKYSLGEKMSRAGLLDYVTDKYNSDTVSDLIGNMAGFVIAGKASGKVASKSTTAVMNTATKFSKAVNLSGKAGAVIERLPTAVTNVGSKVGAIGSKIANSKTGKFLGRPLSKESVDTMLTSYLMTNTESQQIGEDAFKTVYNNILDKQANINMSELIDELKSKNPQRSPEEIQLIAEQKQHQLRNQFEEDPENSKLIKEAAIAGKQAEAFATATNNSLAFLTNLTSANLFVKAPSVSRNLITNPFSGKGFTKGLVKLVGETGQEGLEEGFINQVSQKAGESFGNTGKFNFDDYLENDLFSSEALEQGMMGALMGFGQTGKIMAEQSGGKYLRAKEQKKHIKELVEMQALPVDQLKKLVTSSFNMKEMEAYSQEIQKLTNEGKSKEVKALQEKLLLNQSVRAAVTGTSQVLTDTLTQMSQNEEFSEEDKKNIQKSIQFNEMIANMHDQHNTFNGRNKILQNRGNKFILGEAIKDFQNSTLSEAQKNYDDAADKSIRQKLEASKQGLSESQLEEMTNNYSEMFENAKSTFTPNRTSMIEYDVLLKTKEGITALQNKQDELDDEYKRLTSDEYQAKYKKELGKELVKKVLNSVTRKNAKQAKEEAQQESIDVADSEVIVANEIDKKLYEQETGVEPAPVVETTPEDIQEAEVEEIPLTEEQVSNWVDTINAMKNGTVTSSNTNVTLEPEEDSPFNAPIPVDNTEKSNKVIGSFRDMFSQGGTFKGVIGAIMNEDPSFADEYFEYLAEGYNQAHPESKIGKDEQQRIYKQIFGDTNQVKKTLADIRSIGVEPSNKSIPVTEETPVTPEVETAVEQKSNSNESVTLDIETKQPTVIYEGYKTVSPDIKLSFLGQDVEISEDGKVYTNATNEVNSKAFPAIHFENFKPGDKVSLGFNWNFFDTETTITTYQQNNDGSVDVTPKSIKQFVEGIFGTGYYNTFLEKVKTNEGRAELLQNEEFLGYMPTSTTLSNGQTTELGINSINWWNTKNTALERNAKGEYLVERQRQLINEARLRNLRLRQAMALGSQVELTVESRTEGFHNKLLLEDEYEQTQGHSTKFQSLLDSFKGNEEAANNTLGLGVIVGDAPASFKRNGKIVVKVGNKEVFLSKDNSNIIEFKNSVNISSGNYNGKPFMVYQTGYNSKGEPQYALRAVITNHPEMAQKHQIQFDILQRIKFLGNIANGSIKTDNVNEIEKSKKMFQFFKSRYNINIADWKELSNKLQEYYPKKMEIPDARGLEFQNRKTYKTGDVISTPNGDVVVQNAFKQDYNVSNKDNPTLPDLTGFNTLADFERAVLSDGAIPNTTANKIFMQNTHTQFVFSEISDNQKGSVWTTEVQPKITFSDSFTQAQREEDKVQEIENLQAQLESNQKIQEQIDERLAETEDKLEIRRLEKEKAKLEQERVQVENELISEGLQPKESTKIEPQPNSIQSQIDEINERKKEELNKYSHAITVKSVTYKFVDDNTGTGDEITEVRVDTKADGSVHVITYFEGEVINREIVTNKERIADIKGLIGAKGSISELQEDGTYSDYKIKEDTILEETENIVPANKKVKEINAKYDAEIEVLENNNTNNEVEKKTPRKYDESDLDTINQSLMYNALKNIPGKDFTRQDLLDNVIQEYYSMIDSLTKKGMDKEVEFLKANRAQILGEEYYDGSVMEMIDTLFDLNPNDTLDFTSEFVKDQNKDSSEVDITASLSLRVKMLLSGIQDSRSNTSDSFARLPDFFTFKDTMDFLQQGLSEIHNNSLEDFETWVRAKVAQNPREFIFYNQILKRLKDLKATDEAFLNEIMYFLHQPKVEMTFMMYSMADDGSFTIQKYDANAKSPRIAKKNKWKENLKTSPLIDLYEDNFYTVNQEALAQVDQLYKSIVADREAGNQIKFDELTKYFNFFGITLNQATLRGLNNNVFNDNNYRLYHVEPGQSGTGILAKNQIFENLYKNIQQANLNIGLGFKMTLDKNAVSSSKDVALNPLTSKTTSSLKRLVDADNALSAINYNTMRIAGKSINPFQQSKSITNTVSKLKQDKEFIDKLKRTPITANSFIVEMLEKNPAFTEYFSVKNMSLEAFKRRGTDSRDDMGPTDLSDLDAMVTLINLFGQNDGSVNMDEFENLDIKLRKGSITFPTLSDSSQQPIMNTILLDLQQSNFEDLEMNTLSDNVVAIIANKMVTNELNRVAAFLNSGQSTNIKGHDTGAQLINSIASLNLLLVDTQIEDNGQMVNVKRPLIEVFKNHSNEKGEKWTNNVQEFIEHYQKDIHNEIRDHIKYEVNNTLESFESEGIYTPAEEGLISKIDNEYLKSKGTLKADSKIKLIAYDYVVNNLISLNEIQNLFAGDTANYFKDSMTQDFEFGMPKVTIDDLAQFYYPQLSAQEVESIRKNITEPSTRQLVEERYPKLLSASEIALSEFEDRIENINPIARIKLVDVYKGVQNNLSKRLKELVSPGNQYPNSMSEDQNYLQIMLQDIENSSEVLHSLAQRFHADVYPSYKDKIDEFKRLDDIYPTNRNEVQSKKHKALKSELEKALPEIKSFLKNNTTDAQEYATWQDNLNQLRNQGRVTQEEFEKIFDKLQAQADDIDKLGYITEANKWSKEEKDLRSKSVMQVSKPLYSGHHLEESNGYNHSRYIYIKSSSFALTPELTAGFPKLNNMRKNLERLQVIDPKTRQISTTVRASYDSANKVGAVKQGLPVNELYKEEADFDNTLVSNNTVKLEKANFYIQQDKPFKSDKNAKAGKRDKVTRATQFEKILLGDGINKIIDEYDSKGNLIKNGHIFPNLFDPQLLEEFGIEAGDMLTGPQLKSIYDKTYEKEQRLLTEKFNEELGITDINDIANGKPEVLKKLVEKLKGRLSNKQDLKSLELEYTVIIDNKSKRLTETELTAENVRRQDSGEELLTAIKAQFKIPLYMMPNSNKFESVLNAIINKSNINLEVPGFSAPVASQEGFDFKGYQGQGQLAELKKKGLVTTKNFDPSKGLQATRTEDGKLKYAQVFVANKYKVYNETTGQYDYIDLKNFVDENGQIDTTKLPEELLSMFSFRIPTSSHQSGVIIEVAGFLPHSAADLMIVPKDHTTQIGEDYDIDMRYVYQYNYFLDKKGNLKKMSTEDLSIDNAEATRLKDAYTNFRDTLIDTYFESQDGTARVKNPVFSHNRETMLNIASLNSLLDNWNNSVEMKQSLSEEWELEDQITKADVMRRIQDYELDIIPQFIAQETKDRLRSEYKTLNKQLTEEYNNRRQTTLDYYRAKNQKMNQHKVLENNLVSLYKSVFSSNDDRVQKLINKTLSTDNAENTADVMDNLLNSAKQSPYYSFHSANLQRDILKLGASGKIGIGEHSNAVTMNSLFQQSDFSHQIFKKIDDEGEIVPYNIILGNQIFSGVMGKIVVNGVRISEMAMEDQNSATDNQKLQIMGRRNEDKNTMAVLKILHSGGIENDGIKVSGETLSYASLFINQPVLRKYSRLVNSLSSASNESKGNPKDVAMKQIMEEFKNILPDDVWAIDKYGETIPGVLDSKIYTQVASNLTSEGLYNNLLESESDALSQFVVFKNFLELQNAAKTYNELQRLVNIEKNGMGLSYFDSIELMGTLLNVAGGAINITNSNKMIGEIQVTAPGINPGEGFIPIVTKDSTKRINSDLYNDMRNGDTAWIKPSNHYSHKLVNSVALGYNTYNSLFPYNHSNIDTAITDIMDSLSINENSEQGKQQKYKIISNLKDYIYTNNTTLFEGNINQARKQLFFDNKSQGTESLATYLLKLSEDKNFADLFRKPFFRDLQFEINDISYPSLIKFNNSDISKVNTLSIYNNFEKMMNSKKRLPSFNGKQYSEQSLMKDLLKYSLLADQGNGAIGFRQHLPIKLFERHGVIKGVSNTTNINSSYQSIAYHGAIKTVERIFGNNINEDGDIHNSRHVEMFNESIIEAKDNYPKLTGKQLENKAKQIFNDKINRLVKTTNTVLSQSFGVQDAVSYDYSTNTLNYSLYNGKLIKSDFVKQYIQHNVNSVVNIATKKLNSLLEENAFALEDITNGVVKEFYFKGPNFLTIKDTAGKLHLYEQVANDFYKEIPVLGVFGMKEYNIKNEQNVSQVNKNNPVQNTTVRTAVDQSMLPKLLTNSENGNVVGTNLEGFLEILGREDYQGTYAPLFRLFRTFVNFSNVKIQVGKPGNYSARYYTTGVITINPELINEGRFNQGEIAKVVAEEMMHHITVNTIGRYVQFTGFNTETNSITYDVVKDDFGTPVTVPSEIFSLIAVYNAALRHMAEKHGTEAITNKIKNSEAHLGSNEGVENDLYRVSNIHEFIAGIFMKDEDFAKEMANTPYRNGDESIAEKFLNLLKRLFYKVIPSYKRETVSGEVSQALTQLLQDMTEDKKGKPIKSQFKLIYDTPEKRQAFSNSLKLINELQENQLTREEFLNDEDSGDFFEYEDAPKVEPKENITELEKLREAGYSFYLDKETGQYDVDSENEGIIGEGLSLEKAIEIAQKDYDSQQKISLSSIPKENINVAVSLGNGSDHKSLKPNENNAYDQTKKDVSKPFVHVHKNGEVSYHTPFYHFDNRKGSHLVVAIKGYNKESINDNEISMLMQKIAKDLETKVSSSLYGDVKTNLAMKTIEESINQFLDSINNSNQALNSPMNISTFAEEALKCK